MKLKDLHSLYIHELKDLYSAEKQISKALPKMIKAASNEQLRTALQDHRRQTDEQIHRLEEVFQQLNVNTRGSKCKGMEGLIEEGKMLLEEDASPEVLDAGIISVAQRIEHYEIAGYGCARTFARQLGYGDAAETLQRILDEESAANEKLNQIAMERVNEEAMVGAGHDGSSQS